MREIIITKELMDALGNCGDGPAFIEANNLWGKTDEEVLRAMKDAGVLEPVIFWRQAKSSEAFVRYFGSIFTMGAYQVFNPLTGLHTRYETEAEAKAALVELAKSVLQYHGLSVVQELSNELGDTTWIPTQLHETLTVSI
jgi:hypothetical protein